MAVFCVFQLVFFTERRQSATIVHKAMNAALFQEEGNSLAQSTEAPPPL